jgi:hypothetical protein
MSGDELAQAQNAVILDPELHPADREGALVMISQEINLRQTEGLGRKGERFLNRNGSRIGMFALGALLGVEIGD